MSIYCNENLKRVPGSNIAFRKSNEWCSENHSIPSVEKCIGYVIKILIKLVKPVLSGHPLSGHRVLSGQFPKFRIESHINHTNVTFIKRTPLLSGRGHVNRCKTIPNPCIKRTGITFTNEFNTRSSEDILRVGFKVLNRALTIIFF